MTLFQISARNLKGQTFKILLRNSVAIIGPNFSGKTAIIEAIRLACIGYIPEVGKLPKSTWELSSANEMEVLAEFDGEPGGKISRRFFLKSGSVQSQWSYWDADSKPIADESHPLVNLDLPLLDPEHYFGLTDTQRTDYVFDRIRLPETYSIESIWAEIKRINLGEKHTELVEVAHREALDELNKWFGPGAAVQEALGNAVEACRERYTYWNRRAKETQGAVATLTELKLREKQVRAVPVTLEADIEAAQAELSRLNTEKGRVTGERDAAERNAGRRRQLQQSLDADRIDYPRMLKQKQEEKEALEKDLVPEPKAEEIERLRGEIANASGVKQRAQTTFDTQQQVIVEAEKGLNELGTLKECPYCKSKSKGWADNLEKELTQRKADAVKLQKAAETQISASEGIVRDDSETLEGLLRAQESNHRVREALREIERSIGNLTIDQKNEGERRERWTGEIKDIPKPADVKRLTQQIATLENERVAAATKLSELNGLKSQETQLKQDLLRATESEQEHQAAVAHLTIIKTIADFLKQKREAIICEAFTKLLQVANMVVKSILKSPLVLHENTIGRFDGSKFVPHRVFSGTEKALAYIAIATALSVDAPCKLVLLDEFGRLDAKNQMHMINRLLHLVNEKVIDQFIVIGTEIPKQVTVGKGSKVLQVIELGK